jgi:hypothetical protein
MSRLLLLVACGAVLCAAHSEYLPALLRSIHPSVLARRPTSRSFGAYFASAVNITGTGTNAECYWR